MNINRMEVNAAIERLLGGTDNWEEEAGIIIRNCHAIPEEGSFTIESSSLGKSGGESITGHASGMGDITIQDKLREERKEFTYGRPLERIGYYKVWKQSKGMLVLRHWWKTDLATQSEEGPASPDHYLCYDPETFKPKFFALLRHKPPLRFFVFRITTGFYFDPIYGKV